MYDTDTTLVTAPFIRLVKHENRSYFSRMDSAEVKRCLVSANDTTKHIIEFFRQGRARSELTLDTSTKTNTHALINTLIDRGMLLSIDSLSISAPSIEMEITNRCNAKCVMCPRADLRKLGDMADETFIRCLHLIENTPVSGVILQGIGEPTLHKQLRCWIGELRKVLGARPLVMVTNGIRLSAARLRELREAGLDHVQWSFHSRNPAVYNEIMGSKSFDKANKNIIECAREHGDMLSINFVAMESNLGEIDSFRTWLEKLGLPPSRLRIIPCFSRGGFIDTSALTGKARKQPAGRCLYVKKSLFIAWNGDVLPCSNDIRGDEIYANVLQQDSVALLDKWRDELLSASLNFDICKKCDHYVRDSISTEWFANIVGKPFQSIKAQNEAHRGYTKA